MMTGGTRIFENLHIIIIETIAYDYHRMVKQKTEAPGPHNDV